MNTCPSCGSNNLIIHKRGTSFLNGYIASRAFGPLGWIAANTASDHLIGDCADCHRQFEFKSNQDTEPSTLLQIGQGLGNGIVLIVFLGIIVLILKVITFLV